MKPFSDQRATAVQESPYYRTLDSQIVQNCPKIVENCHFPNIVANSIVRHSGKSTFLRTHFKKKINQTTTDSTPVRKTAILTDTCNSMKC